MLKTNKSWKKTEGLPRIVNIPKKMEKRLGKGKVQATRLKEEGHHIRPSEGKKPPHVKDFEKYL